MGKIREWFREHSTLSTILCLLLTWGCIDLALDFFGKTYKKFYPNECPSYVAVREYERICDDHKVSEEDEFGAEYVQFYDKKGDAVNNFMLLVRSLDKQYANGKFRHCYVLGKERIYQCYDKDKKLIAVRLSRHTGGFWLGFGGGFDEMKPFYSIQFYVER